MSDDGLSTAARRHLLALARRAIEGQLAGVTPAAEDLGELRVELERRRGAFVTLTRRGDGELRPIAPEAIEVGVHGLVIRGNGRSGLLLPQVAAERGWDRERFLDETCRKAGLPAGTWRTPGCEILAFTAVVFGEEEESDPHA